LSVVLSPDIITKLRVLFYTRHTNALKLKERIERVAGLCNRMINGLSVIQEYHNNTVRRHDIDDRGRY